MTAPSEFGHEEDQCFGKRVMFGSDRMVWPGMIEVGIEAIETAEFLSEQEKRDILYNNAARFLRLEGPATGSRRIPYPVCDCAPRSDLRPQPGVGSRFRRPT